MNNTGLKSGVVCYPTCGEYFEEIDLAEGNLILEEVDRDKLLTLIREFMEENAKVSCFKVVDITEHVYE